MQDFLATPGAAMKIDPASGESLARQLVRELRNAIITMRLPPGQILSEQDIATQLGISRAPVREAFIHLRDAGLIRVMPQRGTLVLKISAAAIESVRFIREAIERAVARDAARHATDAAIAQLRASLEAQRQTTVAAVFFALDDQFHSMIAGAAGRPEAWRVVEDLKPQMDRVRYLSMADPIPRETIIGHHTAILDAIAAKDGPAADAAMGVHLSAIIHSLPRLSARYAALFAAE